MLNKRARLMSQIAGASGGSRRQPDDREKESGTGDKTKYTGDQEIVLKLKNNQT